LKHIVGFSGGKDSTALILWAKENLSDFTTVFCDTGWESPITYAYIEEIDRTVLGSSLVTLHSKKYRDMEDCFLDHQMFANSFARFCTEDMKIDPLHEFYASQDDEVTAYQGVRADESDKRRSATEEQWVDAAGGYTIKRPLLRWSATEVFSSIKSAGLSPNALYLMGLSRVGCWPCIHASLRDMKSYLVSTPEIKERLIGIEKKMRDKTGMNDRTFFRHGFIPERFCSVVTAKGHRIPTAEDVFRYIESVDEDQLPMFPARSCMSVYNLCE